MEYKWSGNAFKKSNAILHLCVFGLGQWMRDCVAKDSGSSDSSPILYKHL